MADDSINLLGSIRANLQSLQRTSALERTTERNLSTGRRVNSASDGAVAYFQARALSNRATDLAEVKGAVNQGVSALGAASAGAEGVDRLLGQMKGVALAARNSADPTARAEYAKQYNELRGQIDSLARDSGYQGVNLLSSSSSSLRVEFESGAVEVAPRDVSAAGMGITAVAEDGSDFSAAAAADVDAARSEARSILQSLGGSLQTLSVRADYTGAVINTLRTGEGKLTQADANEEAARLVSLSTRRQLGQTALSIANQSQRSLLAIF